ncbi:MAG TPA: FAD binding domain-containing protein [Acidimicrobiia bacterium]|jgi:CO/xanthine dehydrogenase FAD-binding subunit|nr:FAD binding domain-containing protein [Acidimicrobiia bacterium]
MSLTFPDSLTHALAELADDPEMTILAGGTDLMVEVNDGRRDPVRVLAVARLPELQGIRIEGRELVIGAACTYTELMGEPVRTAAPALAYASRTVGSPQIRNAGTIGGNLGTASPAGDTLPVLVALDARVHVASASGARTIPVREFCIGPKRNALQPGELIVAARVPLRRGPQDYLKVGVRNAMVIAVASLAMAVDVDARTIGIGLGSVGPTPLAADDATAWLAARVEWRADGIVATPGHAEEFGRRVAASARAIDDHRGTADYRGHAIGVLARRALRRAAGTLGAAP